MLCQNCGKNNKNDASFCSECGKKNIEISTKETGASINNNNINNINNASESRHVINGSFFKKLFGIDDSRPKINNTDINPPDINAKTYFRASIINLISIFLLTIFLSIIIWLPGILVLLTPLYVSLGILTWSPFFLAILPIVFSILTEKQLEIGEVEKAISMAKKAKFFIILSIITFIAVILIKLTLFLAIIRTASAIWENLSVVSTIKDFFN